MARRTNRMAWGLAAVLAMALLGGASLVQFVPASSRHLDSALIEATRKGDVAAVKQLLIAGAPANALVSGDTALDIAIHTRRVDLVKLLLEHGADANEPIPVMKDATLSPLDLAVNQDNADIIRLLLAHGANANQTDSETGHTVLMGAATRGQFAAVIALLAGGANPNAQNRHKWTALHWAAAEGQTSIVRALIDHGGNVNAKDGTGWTPLMAAIGGGRRDTVKLLLALGADVNSKMYEKGRTDTALTLARRDGEIARKHPPISKSHAQLNASNYALIIRLLEQGGAKE
jgi:ankyrin repeat protein